MKKIPLDQAPPVMGGRYDWLKFADGEWRVAEAGVDFERAETFRSCLYQWANNRPLSREGRSFKAQSKKMPSGNVMFRIEEVPAS